MAEVIRKATNRFNKGLIMDFSPENTKNNTLTHALNATLLTFNGNELSLQNDMGNARVETAFLPEGYMPVGTCEYGGIIYVVSYNPIEDKSQIGCFPSPERTVSNSELGESDVILENSMFQDLETGILTNTTQCVLLKKNSLNPGDKFVITSNNEIYDNHLKDLMVGDSYRAHPRIALNVVSIEDSGRIVYLNSTVKQYDVSFGNSSYKYHILGNKSESSFEKEDLDSYRNTLSSGYNVFRAKTSGKLALLAELIMIDSYSVTHSLQKVSEGIYNVILHTEVTPEVTGSNYEMVPKLQYHFLKQAQGYLQLFNNDGTPYQKHMLLSDTAGGENSDFFDTKLSDIYQFTDNAVTISDEDTLRNSSFFKFASPGTYCGSDNFIPNESTNYTYPDLQLGFVQMPSIVTNNTAADLPFKYDYTIVPCMNYGKLEHLAVSNTIDFSKLHDFDKSEFTTWKYHIDGDQLRITFGAEIYDTFETDKVNGLILEFYDYRGFAGSLEISNKKSYSGVHTKIISLNALNALRKKKILEDGITENYKHNVLIEAKEGSFYLNNKEVEWDEVTGWNIEESENDCGTLYSNILYGVKSYLRVLNSDGSERYIRKKDLFLYTLPIYNDLFYTLSDFSALEYPQLDMAMTFKLEDDSKRTIYNLNNIKDGYNTSDGDIVSKYKNGAYSDSSFKVTKYYEYLGESKLYLEVGLKQEYNDFYIYQSPELNSYFSCKLQLIGDESDTDYLNVKSGLNLSESGSDLLNYNNNIDFAENYIRFSNDKQTLSVSDLRAYNFINTPETSHYIPLTYHFVVGYEASVNDIKKTPVPATTVCALYHKNENGVYNSDDFGVHIQKEYNANGSSVDCYYSNAMFYNTGTDKEAVFGICKQIASTGSLEEQCQVIDYDTRETVPVTTLGQFNAGAPLKHLVPHIGKYTFCQPHAHGLGSEYGVNIIKTKEGMLMSNAIAPATDEAFKQDPLYNLSLNTKGVIEYNIEFLSSIEDKKSTEPQGRLFTGIRGKDIEFFNRALLKTMSKVYAYNPDYDSIKMNVGNVSVSDKKVQFTSNIISTDAKFNFEDKKTLNDYIYIGGNILVSEYLKDLEKYSTITTEKDGLPINQVQFKPNCTYCGNSGSAYLISTLTYNTPVPEEIEQDLTFSVSDLITVKHSDGSFEFLRGNLNKRTLYGFKNNCLVQLDVSNYTIDGDGSLTISDDTMKVEEQYLLEYEYSASDFRGQLDEVKSENNLNTTVTDITLFGNKISDTKGEMEVNINIKALFATHYTDKDGNEYIIAAGSKNKPVHITPEIIFTPKDNLVEKGTTCMLIEVSMVSLKKDKIGVLSNNLQDPDKEYYISVQEPEKLAYIVDNPMGMLVLVDSAEVENIVSISDIVNTGVRYDSGFGSQGDVEFNFLENEELTLCKIRIYNIINTITLGDFIDSGKISVVHVAPTPYNKYLAPGTSYVVQDEYKNATLAKTSLTLNDLQYEPSILGHRLFVVKNVAWRKCFGEYHGDIYYRRTDQKESHTGTDDLNKLSLYIGPCFINK